MLELFGSLQLLEADNDLGLEPVEGAAGEAERFLLLDEGDVVLDGFQQVLAEHGLVLADIEPAEGGQGGVVDGNGGEVVVGDVQHGEVAEFLEGSVLNFADVVVGDVEAEGGGVACELVGDLVDEAVGDGERQERFDVAVGDVQDQLGDGEVPHVDVLPGAVHAADGLVNVGGVAAVQGVRDIRIGSALAIAGVRPTEVWIGIVAAKVVRRGNQGGRGCWNRRR